MKIARNDTRQAYGAGWQPLDGIVSYEGRGEHAERKHRQIIEALWTVDTVAEVTDIMAAHAVDLDAMMLSYSDYLDAVQAVADEVTQMLTAAQSSSGAPVTAHSSTSQTQEKIIMFATNQTEGSHGPWMYWSSNGSAAKEFPPKSWIIRGKDEKDERYEQVIEGFANPCVFDLDTLQLGWEKDGATGQGPERRYSSHYSVAMPRPDESKDNKGHYAWSNCLQVRVAISQTQAVTWEQGSFGAYQGFTKLAKLIEQQWEANSQNGALLPVVQMTGVDTRTLSSGSTNIPVLEIVKWMPRPDVLKDDAPIITAPAPAAAPAAAAQPAPEPQPTQQAKAAIPADAGF